MFVGWASSTSARLPYYRLRRVILDVPPVRARRDAIPLLVEHICVQANDRYGLAIAGVTREALRFIQDAPWPGNVRQLEAVLEEAMIIKGGGSIGSDDLALERSSPREVPGVAGGGEVRAGLVAAGLLRRTGAGRGTRYVWAARREVGTPIIERGSL